MQLQFKYGWMLSCWYHISLATLGLNSPNSVWVNKLCTAELHLMHQFQTFLDQEAFVTILSCLDHLSAGLLECTIRESALMSTQKLQLFQNAAACVQLFTCTVYRCYLFWQCNITILRITLATLWFPGEIQTDSYQL